jgi:hypothetical protein
LPLGGGDGARVEHNRGDVERDVVVELGIFVVGVELGVDFRVVVGVELGERDVLEKLVVLDQLELGQQVDFQELVELVG